MRRPTSCPRLLVAMLVFLGFLMVEFCGARDPKATAPSADDGGPTTCGLRLSIRFDEIARSDEPLRLTAALRNVSDRSVTLGILPGGPDSEFRLQIRTPEGNEMSPRSAQKGAGVRHFSFHSLELPPKAEYTRTVSLNEEYDLTATGTYSIKAQWMVSLGDTWKAPVSIESNSTTVTVTAFDQTVPAYGGCELSIRFEKTSIQVGEPLTLVATLRNTSEKTVAMFRKGPETDYRLSVKDAQGKDIPPRDDGKMLGPISARFLRLAPKSETVDRVSVTQMYEMTTSGTYTVRAVRTIIWPDASAKTLSVESNVTTITLTSPPPLHVPQ